jgi:predicted naringenin-chalcone synthase
VNYINHLGFTWRNGRLRVLLSREVPEIAAELIEVAVNRLLQRHGLKANAIKHWIIHAAGSRIIDNIRDALKLPEEKMSISRWTLRNYGNTSATSVGITGKRLMELNTMKQGDYGLVLSLGPGMTGGATLLQW